MPKLTVFINEAWGRNDHNKKSITAMNRPARYIPEARILIWYRGTGRAWVRRYSISLSERNRLFVPAFTLVIAQWRICCCRGVTVVMQQRFRRTDRLSRKRKRKWSMKRGRHEARHLEEIRERERAVDQQLNGLSITIFKESRVLEPIISMIVAATRMDPT